MTVDLLNIVAKDMRELADSEDPDLEEGHSEADSKLLVALRILAFGTPAWDTVVDIITAYEDVGKWYA